MANRRTPEPIAAEPPVAQIEDLDPEPPGPAGNSHRREWLVGLALVVILAGVGLWQTAEQQARLAHYQAGARAAAAGDWAAARAAYAAAQGYADAAQRADHASQMQVYAAALSGTVALRPAASPRGLYSFGAGGWQALGGSDLQSRVLARCPGGALLLDAPWGGPGLPPSPEPGRVPARRLLIDTWAGFTRATLAIDPARFTSFRCTADGVWAYRAVDVLAGYGDAHTPVSRLLIAYADARSGRVVTPTVPGPPWAVTGITPDGQHLLLVDAGGPAHGDWQTPLYLDDVDGDERRFLATLPGAPAPDPPAAGPGTVLITVYRPLADAEHYQNTVLLLDLAGGAPRPLADVAVPAAVFEDHLRIQAQVIPSGPRAGMVLLIWPEGDHAVVRLVDPRVPDAPRDVRTGPGLDDLRVLDAAGPDGLILLAGAPGASGPAARRTLLTLDAAGRLQAATPPLDSRDTLDSAWVRDGRLLYSSGSYTALWSLPLDRLADPPPSTIVYSGTVWSVPPALGPPWYVGSALLAYTTPRGELHAITFDGHNDWLLESGVAAFADPAAYR